jgi:membrane peptidoglycan carboxypeptidase
MDGRVTNFGNVVSLLAAFVATAVVMGLLSAGLLIPAVGATGNVATSGVQAFDNLPGEFTSSPLSQQSKILDAKGNVIATPQEENRIILNNLSDVSPIMQKAQVAIEDSRFYQHGGVDPRGIARALVSNAQGGGVQGASTLTQQFVKLTLQENALRNNDQEAAKAAVARSYSRKLQELKYAVTLEKQMTKDQILLGYFNLAYYGDLAYGIEAASEHYFGIPAKQLNLPQAALLAGLVQNPSTTDPAQFPQKAQARRDVVLDRMNTLGIITAKETAAAKAIPVAKSLHLKRPVSNCAASSQPYFCNYVIDYLKQLPALGKTEPERIRNITQGGLTIQTTLNPDIQKAAVQHLTARVPIGNSEGIGAATSIVEPGTGKVLAMAQNTTYTTGAGSETHGLTQVNWNVDRNYGGENGFQFGSTAKMYAIVTALENGTPINAMIDSKYATPTHPAIYSVAEQGACHSQVAWPVKNDPGITGGQPLPFAYATAHSVNTAFASLVLKLGTPNVRKTMTTMGLHSGDGQQIPCGPAAVTLGAGTVTPLTLASSYATLAANGKYCPPDPILSITTTEGHKPIKLTPPACRQVIDPDIAKGATELLTNPVKPDGTGAAAALSDRPVAGKTGTTDNHYQSWFVGFTPQLATAVWVGTPYHQFRMKNVTLAGQYYGEVFGGTISAPVWHDIMAQASQGMAVRQFDPPSSKIASGDMVAIPYVSGMSVAQATAALSAAGFSAQVTGQTNSSLPQGTVVYTTPGGTALRGSSVGLVLSTGYVPPPPAPAPKPTPTATPTTTKPAPTPSTTSSGKGKRGKH